MLQTASTKSVATGFGRHDMPLPASNDTGTVLCQDGSDWSLQPWTLTLEVMVPVADVGHRPPSISSSEFIDLAFRQICSTMCVSINGSGDPDLKTGMRVASKVGKIPSKFGHTQPLASQLICYVRDGRTDRQTKAMLTAPFPTGGGA